jgi:hypothetical protein
MVKNLLEGYKLSTANTCGFISEVGLQHSFKCAKQILGEEKTGKSNSMSPE